MVVTEVNPHFSRVRASLVRWVRTEVAALVVQQPVALSHFPIMLERIRMYLLMLAGQGEKTSLKVLGAVNCPVVGDHPVDPADAVGISMRPGLGFRPRSLLPHTRWPRWRGGR
jgi:hypothetical protein